MGCESLSAAAVSPGATDNWAEAVAEVISRMLGATPRRLRAVLVLPSDVFLLKQMRTPRVSPAKSRQVLEFAVGQQIPHATGEMVWDTLNSGTYGEENDHLVVAVKTQTVTPLFRVLRDARLELGTVLPSILTLHAAGPISFPVCRPRRLLIEPGTPGTTFLQTEGTRFAVRSLGQVASKSMTPPEATAIVESGDGILRLAQEATRTLLHFNRQNHFETPEQVVLAAGEAWDPEKVSRLGEQLKLAVECPGPVSLAPIPADGIGADGTTFARLLGGAAIGLGRAGLAVNLMPPEICQQESSRKRKPWLVMATLLAASALLPPILLLRLESAAMQRESQELEKALAPLQARSKRLQEQQAQIAALKRESERLQTLRSRRTGWLEFFAAVQARLAAVDDVWLERLQTIAPEGGVPMKLVIRGYLLDRGTIPVAAKMKTLIRELRTIPGVGAVEGESFDGGRPHLLRFELVLVGNATHPL